MQIFRSIDSNSVKGFPKDPKDATVKVSDCCICLLIDEIFWSNDRHFYFILLYILVLVAHVTFIFYVAEPGLREKRTD